MANRPSVGLYHPTKAMFKQPTQTQEKGEPVSTLEDVFSTPIRFKPTASAREAVEVGVATSGVTQVARIPMNSKTKAIKPNMVFSHDFAKYEIVGEARIDYMDQEIEIFCVRKTNLV